MKPRSPLVRALVALAVVALVALARPSVARAQATLITGLGGPAGYGTNVLAAGDDNSSVPISLTPYDLNGLCFFGMTHTTLYINNNGNITLNGPVGAYTPNPFPASTNPMIAPWWADVDTRGAVPVAGENTVYWDIRNVGGLGQLVVTWDRVGYFASKVDKRDTFQLVIRETSASSSTAPADYTVEFRYNELTWTTGDASGGMNGLGGTPAQAGFDAGDMLHYSQLPGSRTASVLNLLTTSNVTPAVPGLWSFRFHSCQLACMTNADCAGPTPICDGSSHTCRPCTMDTDCGGSTPHCATTGTNTGRCVQCVANAQCTTNMCSATNACVCTTNANCSGSTPICDTGTHVCRSCNPSTPTDCVLPDPVCGPVGACVQCGPGLTAACTAPNLACSAAGACVQCAAGMTTACTGTTPVCNTTTDVCRPCAAATQATDCPSALAPLCETVGALTGACVPATSTVILPATGSTTDLHPTVTGTAPPGSTVVIYIDGVEVARTTATAAGTYSATPPMALSVGMHTASSAVAVGAGTGPMSAANSFTAVQCLANADCTGGPAMLCDTVAHVCRGCLTRTDCSGSAPVCDAGTHVCRACAAATQAADCPVVADPICVTLGPMAGVCTTATATVTNPMEGSSSSAREPTVTGTAPPGSTVVVYIDGVEVGRTTAGAGGTWSFTPTTPLTVGMHTASASVLVNTTPGAMSAPNHFTVLQCTSSADCSAPTPVCDTTTNVCHGCNTNLDCRGATPVCDTTTRLCRGCGSDADCSGATPACAPTGACVACTATNATLCTGSTPVCNVAAFACVLCTPGATGNAMACASSTDGHACEPPAVSTAPFCGCGTDADCGDAMSGRICDTTTSHCLAGCHPGTGNNGCPAGQFCTSDSPTVAGVCTTTCNFDSDCSTLPMSPFCLTSDGGTSQCVQCITDTQCASRTDMRVQCIGDNHTCAQCSSTSHGMCTPTGLGAACLSDGLCGCASDADCSADRMCNTTTNRCDMRAMGGDGGVTDGGVTDGGNDAGVQDSGTTSDSAVADARTDGGTHGMDSGTTTGTNITGGGACACSVPGAPARGTDRGGLAALFGGLAAALVARRRRRTN